MIVLTSIKDTNLKTGVWQTVFVKTARELLTKFFYQRDSFGQAGNGRVNWFQVSICVTERQQSSSHRCCCSFWPIPDSFRSSSTKVWWACLGGICSCTVYIQMVSWLACDTKWDGWAKALLLISRSILSVIIVLSSSELSENAASNYDFLSFYMKLEPGPIMTFPWTSLNSPGTHLTPWFTSH